MNKIFTLAMVVLASGSLTANAEKGQRMTEKSDEMYAESYKYKYDDQNRLIRIDCSNEDEYYREFILDEKGQVVREDLFQYIYPDGSDDGEWFLTSSAAYKYDDEGRMILRYALNYDITNNELYMPCGVYRYVYDDNGRLTNRYTLWAESLDDPCDKVEDATQDVRYMYDDEGRLIQEDDVTKSFFYEQESTFTSRYFYDGKGRVVVVQNIDNGIPSTHQVWEYDDADNLAEVYTTGSVLKFEIDKDGKLALTSEPNKTGRRVFSYTDFDAKLCVYPINPEDISNNEVYVAMTHQLEMEEVWSRADDGNIYPTNNWEYQWEDCEVAGIENITDGAYNSFNVFVSGNELKFAGASEFNCVRIYDLQGRMVQQNNNVNGSVNVANLQKGVYVIYTAAGAQKFVR